MSKEEPGNLTALLRQWAAGDATAWDRLAPLVYEGLRKVATKQMGLERAGHPFRPSDLVHEACLRLIGPTRTAWRDRNHFYAVASTIMRWVLVDEARKNGSLKRGRNSVMVPLDGRVEAFSHREPVAVDLVALGEALDELEKKDPRLAKVVDLRFFGGFSREEIATMIGVSPATVARDWRFAKTWLTRRLKEQSADGRR